MCFYTFSLCLGKDFFFAVLLILISIWFWIHSTVLDCTNPFLTTDCSYPLIFCYFLALHPVSQFVWYFFCLIILRLVTFYLISFFSFLLIWNHQQVLLLIRRKLFWLRKKCIVLLTTSDTRGTNCYFYFCSEQEWIALMVLTDLIWLPTTFDIQEAVIISI